MGKNEPLVWQNYIKIFAILACNSTYVQTMLLRISNLRSLTQIVNKQTCCIKVSRRYHIKNKPLSTKIKGTSGLCVRFLKNVDGQGTQSINKNLNLKKSKSF